MPTVRTPPSARLVSSPIACDESEFDEELNTAGSAQDESEFDDNYFEDKEALFMGRGLGHVTNRANVNVTDEVKDHMRKWIAAYKEQNFTLCDEIRDLHLNTIGVQMDVFKDRLLRYQNEPVLDEDVVFNGKGLGNYQDRPRRKTLFVDVQMMEDMKKYIRAWKEKNYELADSMVGKLENEDGIDLRILKNRFINGHPYPRENKFNNGEYQRERRQKKRGEFQRKKMAWGGTMPTKLKLNRDKIGSKYK
mmetsp:Transcript_92118/g.169036  ORF Transcript_92118/g.169036 Transcript_92118/m.169036 type:complete len:249 (+) Transcript_92118:1-747(+)